MFWYKKTKYFNTILNKRDKNRNNSCVILVVIASDLKQTQQ